MTLAPDTITRDVLRNVTSAAEFKPIGKNGVLAAYNQERLVGFINPANGESQVFPEIETLKPGARAEQARVIAARLVEDGRLFPKDATQAVPLNPVTLSGLQHSQRGGERAKPSDYLSYVRFQRRVNGVPVFGPGTRAMIAVAADNSIHAFAHRWRSASLSEIK